jgi:hypothetical protein
MKKSFIAVAVSLMFLTGGIAFAQNEQVALPSAGLTPDSPFYFLDRLGETLQRFFTFNPEAKARLEITFAAERIAEIKVVLLDGDIQDKSLALAAVAEAGLKDNLARAAEIVAAEKAKGNNVSRLANSLNDEVNQNKELLKGVFEGQKQTLEAKEDELKVALRQARQSGDAAIVESLTKELQNLELQKEALDKKESEDEDAIEAENEKLEERMEAKDEAAKKILEAEKEKAEIVSEYQKEGVAIPARTFSTFDSVLAQAKAALAAGNYEEAKQLAKQAKHNLENVDEALDELKDAKEHEKELKEEMEDRQKETEEKLQEADKEKAEQIREENKQEEERIQEEQKQAEEKRKDAEEKLREGGQEEGR